MTHIRNPQEITSIRSTTDLTDAEVKTIASFVIANELKNPSARYLEVGVLAGATIRFCKQFTKTTHFTGVDLFEDFVTQGDNTHISGTFRRDDILSLIGDRATLIKGSSHEILPQFFGKEKFDFIFIDGNHTFKATMQDFVDASLIVHRGGYVAFHNASTHMGPDFEIYNTVDGGPWLVGQEILSNKDWQLVESVDRLKVFKKLV